MVRAAVGAAAVPASSAAVLARSMLPPGPRPKIVTTLHGTDTTLLGRDPGYGPAIRYALACSDAVTVVSEYLRDETRRVLDVDRPIDLVHNFFEPRPPRQTRDEVRHQLGVTDEVVVLHSSNLRPVKRIDLLPEAAARVRPRQSFRLVILAGEDFAPFAGDVHRLGLEGRVVVLERVPDIEDYLQVAGLGLFTSDSESFCLSILEAMCFGCPSIATRVGGIPEVVADGVSGVLVAPGDAAALVRAVETVISDPAQRIAPGEAARHRARTFFGRRRRPATRRSDVADRE
ncbi:MAG: glycosyltransferase [Isosphaeraceae bacterium]|jgi:L-malate glycosyltransferase